MLVNNKMIALFFEVQVKQGKLDQYLDLAGSLKPALDALGGCVFIDRFKSLSRENLILSYQIWQDEAALVAWRVDAKHHKVQEAGREDVFSDYRIRVAQVVNQQRPNEAPWEPERLTPYNDPTRRPASYVIISECETAALPVNADHSLDGFESVYRPGVFAHLGDTPNLEAGIDLGLNLLQEKSTEYFRVCEVMRDYGMFQRKEAPQFYPPIN